MIRRNEHLLVTIDVLRRHFGSHSGIIVDAGAFDGDSTIILANAFPDNRIIGFEPNESTFLKAKINTQKFRNVYIENLALGDQKRTAEFFLSANAASSSLFQGLSEFELSGKTNVNVISLDQYISAHDQVLLIKMDIQGGEAAMLRGSSKTLERTQAVLTELIVGDLYQGGCKYFEVDEILRAAGFRLFSIISNYNNQGTQYYDALYLNQAFLEVASGRK